MKSKLMIAVIMTAVFASNVALAEQVANVASVSGDSTMPALNTGNENANQREVDKKNTGPLVLVRPEPPKNDGPITIIDPIVPGSVSPVNPPARPQPPLTLPTPPVQIEPINPVPPGDLRPIPAPNEPPILIIDPIVPGPVEPPTRPIGPPIRPVTPPLGTLPEANYNDGQLSVQSANNQVTVTVGFGWATVYQLDLNTNTISVTQPGPTDIPFTKTYSLTDEEGKKILSYMIDHVTKAAKLAGYYDDTRVEKLRVALVALKASLERKPPLPESPFTGITFPSGTYSNPKGNPYPVTVTAANDVLTVKHNMSATDGPDTTYELNTTKGTITVTSATIDRLNGQVIKKTVTLSINDGDKFMQALKSMMDHVGTLASSPKADLKLKLIQRQLVRVYRLAVWAISQPVPVNRIGG